MIGLRSFYIVLSVFSATISAPAAATVAYDNLDQHSLTSFISFSDRLYAGQSFFAPSGFLQDLTFRIGSSGPPEEFSVLLTTAAPGGRYPGLFHPDSVIFESQLLVIPDPSDANTYNVTVNLGGVDVADGELLTWLLDIRPESGKSSGQFAILGDVGGTAGLTGTSIYYSSSNPSDDRDIVFADVANWVTSAIPPTPPDDRLFRLTTSDQLDTSRAGTYSFTLLDGKLKLDSEDIVTLS